MATLAEEAVDEAQFFDEEGSRRLFDEIAQRYLGISGQEFVRRWEHGEYNGDCDRPEVVPVSDRAIGLTGNCWLGTRHFSTTSAISWLTWRLLGCV